MNDEPQTLLRIELREPSVYNSILEAISNGCNKIREIADRIHEEKSKCSKYMLTLQTLRLIEKCVPCTEPETSKKGIYEITDNYYKLVQIPFYKSELLFHAGPGAFLRRNFRLFHIKWENGGGIIY